MATLTTIARPYAKALFNLAVEHDTLNEWSKILPVLALIAKNKDMQFLYDDPRITKDQIVKLFETICGKDITPNVRNLLHFLAAQHRLNALPAIAELFKSYKTAREKIVNITVTSALPINAGIQKKLKQALQIRLQCAVNLGFEKNPDLIGGAIIRAGDLVIDGSVHSKLVRLLHTLTS